jgi:ribosomal protein L24E
VPAEREVIEVAECESARGIELEPFCGRDSEDSKGTSIVLGAGRGILFFCRDRDHVINKLQRFL